jgi:hypothetical protein
MLGRSRKNDAQQQARLDPMDRSSKLKIIHKYDLLAHTPI